MKHENDKIINVEVWGRIQVKKEKFLCKYTLYESIVS
jgi:hypothetical protein